MSGPEQEHDHDQEPAEGSRETVDRELKRQDQNKGAKNPQTEREKPTGPKPSAGEAI